MARASPKWVRGVGEVALFAAAAQFVPSTVVLGQWGPWRALPAGLCRWRGPGSGDSSNGKVALTFDDGPDPASTPAVLDELDELGLRATFFCLGSRAEDEPDLIAEVSRRGHQVGTHGYRHEHHLGRSPRWVVEDLRSARRVMDGLGMPASWYRPTYGQATGTTLAAARLMGMRTVLWSAWGREWTTSDPDEVAGRINRRVRDGAIILLHDSDRFGSPGMWTVGLAALARVAQRLSDTGLQAVTLDELVSPHGRTTAVVAEPGSRIGE